MRMPASAAIIAPVVGALGVTAALAQAIDPSLVVRPDGAPRFEAPETELAELGAELFADTSLSGSGNVSCSTCHSGLRGYNATFHEPYPHEVGMATGQAGLGEITAETMVQLCMVAPMGADPLPWGSQELAALAAYVEDERERFAEQAE